MWPVNWMSTCLRCVSVWVCACVRAYVQSVYIFSVCVSAQIQNEWRYDLFLHPPSTTTVSCLVSTVSCIVVQGWLQVASDSVAWERSSLQSDQHVQSPEIHECGGSVYSMQWLVVLHVEIEGIIKFSPYMYVYMLRLSGLRCCITCSVGCLSGHTCRWCLLFWGSFYS